MAGADFNRRAPSPRSAVLRALFSPALISFVAGGAFAAWGYLAAGKTLGALFAGAGAIPLIAPGIIVCARSEGECFRGFVSALAGIGTVWSISLSGSVRILEWLDCIIVLSTLGLAVCGLSIALLNLRINRSLAYAITIVLGLLWLTWPIWTATWLRGVDKQAIVDKLISVHPLFVINAAVARSLPVPWTQFRIAYTIMSVGQDTPFALPKNLAGCAWLHILVGLALAAATGLLKHALSRRDVDASPVS